MDEALLQNPQDNIDDQDGHEQQQYQTSEGRLKCLRGSLQGGGDGGGQDLFGLSVEGVDGITQGDARFQVEAEGDGRRLAQVIYGERANFLLEVGDRA